MRGSPVEMPSSFGQIRVSRLDSDRCKQAQFIEKITGRDDCHGFAIGLAARDVAREIFVPYLNRARNKESGKYLDAPLRRPARSHAPIPRTS